MELRHRWEGSLRNEGEIIDFDLVVGCLHFKIWDPSNLNLHNNWRLSIAD